MWELFCRYFEVGFCILKGCGFLPVSTCCKGRLPCGALRTAFMRARPWRMPLLEFIIVLRWSLVSFQFELLHSGVPGGWGYSSVVQNLLRVCDVLGSIYNMEGRREARRRERGQRNGEKKKMDILVSNSWKLSPVVICEFKFLLLCFNSVFREPLKIVVKMLKCSSSQLMASGGCGWART